MRAILTLGLLICISVSCNNPSGTAAKSDSASMAKPVYAYTISKPDNWDIGSSKNTEIALNALKAFEKNKIEESLGYFADSVEWNSDYMEGKVPKDSLRAMFTAGWKGMASMKVIMDDFVSVISKDKKDEWVTIWYKQIMTDKKGKTDSMTAVNDLKISNGKIVVLSEEMRHSKIKK